MVIPVRGAGVVAFKQSKPFSQFSTGSPEEYRIGSSRVNSFKIRPLRGEDAEDLEPCLIS